MWGKFFWRRVRLGAWQPWKRYVGAAICRQISFGASDGKQKLVNRGDSVSARRHVGNRQLLATRTDPRAGQDSKSLMKVETRTSATVRRESKSEKLERASPDTAQALGKRFFPRLAGVAQMTASGINMLHRIEEYNAVSATRKTILWQDQNGRTLCPKCRRCAQASEALDPMRVI